MKFSISAEFQHLVSYIQDTWRTPCRDDFMGAVKLAFNRGLSDGRLWLDSDITVRAAAILHGDGVMSPLRGWRKGVGLQSLFDALCLFDRQLRHAVSAFNGVLLAPDNWQYTRNARLAVSDATRRYRLDGIAPLPMTRQQQDKHNFAYRGFISRIAAFALMGSGASQHPASFLIMK